MYIILVISQNHFYEILQRRMHNTAKLFIRFWVIYYALLILTIKIMIKKNTLLLTTDQFPETNDVK